MGRFLFQFLEFRLPVFKNSLVGHTQLKLVFKHSLVFINNHLNIDSQFLDDSLQTPSPSIFLETSF
jgi:hypothetical protein